MPQTNASNTPRPGAGWVVVVWTGQQPAEHTRRTAWVAADAVRSALKEAGHVGRVTIEASEAWDAAKP